MHEYKYLRLGYYYSSTIYIHVELTFSVQNELMRFLQFFIGLLLVLKNINGIEVFDTQAYASAHPCVWSACEGLPTEQENYAITCCILQVPLNYAKPNQSSISVSMIRLSPSNTSTNFLFTLSGGPGESVLGLLQIVVRLVPAKYGITIIAPDHRGTGYSTPLGCDDNLSQNVTKDCLTYLRERWTIEGLNQFTTTAASHDLAIQIQAAQLNGRISIYGVSYGTYWLNRFLTIYPNLAQSAIMDSPVNPFLHTFTMYNIRASTVGIQYLTHCHYQIECIKQVPNSSPIIMLHQILQEIDENKRKCVNKYLAKYRLTSNSIRQIFFILIHRTTTDATIIPAVIFRLNRCNEQDAIALDFFFKSQTSSSISSRQILSQGTTNILSYVSAVLYYNIAFSELWLSLNQSDVNEQTFSIWQNSTLICPDLTADFIRSRANWPKYPQDQYRYRLANSRILMINGQLDAATPFDLATHLSSIKNTNQTLFYSIPLSGHAVFAYAFISGYTCPVQLSLSWAFPDLFPSNWSDSSCLQDLPTTIDFAGETNLTQTYSLQHLNTSLPFGQTKTSNANNLVNSHFILISILISEFLLAYFK